MKPALALLVICTTLLAAGCEKKKPPPPPPNPVIGAWACTATDKSATAKMGVSFAKDGTLDAKITARANAEGKQQVAKVEAVGKWSTQGRSFSQDFKTITVVSSTSNGDSASDGAATSLVHSLLLEAKGHAIEKLDETDFVYATKTGKVECRRSAAG